MTAPAPAHAFYVTHTGPDGDDHTDLLLSAKGTDGARAAMMTMLTLGGTVPTRRRVTGVEDLGPYGGAHLL